MGLVQACKTLPDNTRRFIGRCAMPENIFIINKENDVKIGDFGSGRLMDYTGVNASTKTGTVAYMSPEIIKGKEHNDKTDVWSLGVIMYEIITGNRPFTGPDQLVGHEIVSNDFKRIAEQTFDARVSSIIHNMLSKKINDRLSVLDILKKSVIQEYAMNLGIEIPFEALSPKQTEDERSERERNDPAELVERKKEQEERKRLQEEAKRLQEEEKKKQEERRKRQLKETKRQQEEGGREEEETERGRGGEAERKRQQEETKRQQEETKRQQEEGEREKETTERGGGEVEKKSKEFGRCKTVFCCLASVCCFLCCVPCCFVYFYEKEKHSAENSSEDIYDMES